MVNFYEKTVHYSELFLEKGANFVKNNYMNFFILIMVIVGANMSQRAITVVRNNKKFNAIVSDIQNEYNIQFNETTQGSSYESADGIIEYYRLVGKDGAHQVYIKNHDYDTPYILDEKEDVWVDNQLYIPPVISKAFIFHDIGIVEDYNAGIAIVDGKEYIVETDKGRVKIDDIGIYAPLPPQPDRVIKFIENYTSVPYEELELISSILKDDKEIVYAESENEVYAIHLFFDDSVDIGIISEGKEKIKSTNSF